MNVNVWVKESIVNVFNGLKLYSQFKDKDWYYLKLTWFIVGSCYVASRGMRVDEQLWKITFFFRNRFFFVVLLLHDLNVSLVKVNCITKLNAFSNSKVNVCSCLRWRSLNQYDWIIIFCHLPAKFMWNSLLHIKLILFDYFWACVEVWGTRQEAFLFCLLVVWDSSVTRCSHRVIILWDSRSWLWYLIWCIFLFTPCQPATNHVILLLNICFVLILVCLSFCKKIQL